MFEEEALNEGIVGSGFMVMVAEDVTVLPVSSVTVA
jgi:hypothetical protein